MSSELFALAGIAQGIEKGLEAHEQRALQEKKLQLEQQKINIMQQQSETKDEVQQLKLERLAQSLENSIQKNELAALRLGIDKAKTGAEIEKFLSTELDKQGSRLKDSNDAILNFKKTNRFWNKTREEVRDNQIDDWKSAQSELSELESQRNFYKRQIQETGEKLSKRRGEKFKGFDSGDELDLGARGTYQRNDLIVNSGVDLPRYIVRSEDQKEVLSWLRPGIMLPKELEGQITLQEYKKRGFFKALDRDFAKTSDSEFWTPARINKVIRSFIDEEHRDQEIAREQEIEQKQKELRERALQNFPVSPRERGFLPKKKTNVAGGET